MTREEKSMAIKEWCETMSDDFCEHHCPLNDYVANKELCYTLKSIFPCDIDRNYDILVHAGLIAPDDEIETADDKVDEAHKRFMSIGEDAPAEEIQRKRVWLLEMCDKTQNSDEGCHSCPYFNSRCKDFVISTMSANNVIEWFNDWNKKLFHNENDAVHSPSHYTRGGIECIQAIKASMTADGFCDYCKGNVLKYIWRWRGKGGVQDLEKAKVYLDWLIETAKGEA